MGIRLIMGRSGSGKSTYLYDHVIRESIKNPNQRFFILVPDQFTMQAQKDIIMRHPQNGILNIEVLSFTRLAYRVLGETGGESLKVLDDAGKSLILRKVAANSKDELLDKIKNIEWNSIKPEDNKIGGRFDFSI